MEEKKKKQNKGEKPKKEKKEKKQKNSKKKEDKGKEKVKQETKNSKTKKVIKIIGFILGLILLAGLVTGGVFLFLKNSHDREDINNLTYVGVLEDGTYYIPKAKKDIRFPIDSLDINAYVLTNASGENVESKIVEKDGEKLIQAVNNYQEGETYTLELTNTNFTEERIKDAKKLIFKIEESEKAEFQLADNVKVIKEQDLTVEQTNNQTTVNIQGKDIKEDDILLIEEGNDYENAYQVETIENGTATLSAPEVADIYEEFDLYKEEKINFNELQINQDLEDQIEMNLKQSALYQMLVNESYAAENVGTSVKVTPNGNQLTIEMKIEVKASGKAFLGIETLKNHDMILKYTIDLEASFLQDIEKGKNINLDLALKEGFQFDVELKANYKILEGVDDLSDEEYNKTIQDIIEKLEGTQEDTSKGKASIGGIEVPTGITGVNAYFDIYFQTELGISATLTYQQRVELSQNVGIMINSNGITPYANMATPETSNEINILGKVDMTAGVGFDVGISIISKDLAHVSIGEELGIYGEAFATMSASYHSNNNQINANFVGKVEAGIYLKTKYSAGIDIFFIKANKEGNLADTRIPLIKIGSDEITKGIKAMPTTVSISNQKITVPTITKVIYNITTKQERQETCNNVSFVDANGNALIVSGNTIDLGSNKNTTIKAIYTENGKTYQTEINVSEQSSSNPYNQTISMPAGSQNTNIISAYETFIRNKSYQPNMAEGQNEVKHYCIYDINQDGTEELLLMSEDDIDMAWKNTMVYTYTSGKVTFVQNINSYGEIRYQKENKEILFTNTKPFAYVNAYSFYQLVGTELKWTKTVGLVDEGLYMIFEEGKEDREITAEESRSYYENLYYFAFKETSDL